MVKGPLSRHVHPVRHTSATDYGQIYVPRVNLLLAIGVVLLVLIFRNSDSLLAA